MRRKTRLMTPKESHGFYLASARQNQKPTPEPPLGATQPSMPTSGATSRAYSPRPKPVVVSEKTLAFTRRW